MRGGEAGFCNSNSRGELYLIQARGLYLGRKYINCATGAACKAGKKEELMYNELNEGQSVTDQMMRDHFTGHADTQDLMVLSLSLALFLMVAVLIASMAPVIGGVIAGLIGLAYIGLVVVPMAINVIVWVRDLITNR